MTAEQLAAIMPAATDLLSDEPEKETSLHALQVRLLVNILEWYWRERDDFFIGDNLTIFFSREQLKTNDFRGPDFFLVKAVKNHPRTSWVLWEEGKAPDLIIELLSDRTAEIDRDIKKPIYEQRLRTPEYFWFSPLTGEFAGFRLVSDQYEEIVPDAQGRRWSRVLNLSLGVHNHLLRYFTGEGELVPTPNEEAEDALFKAERAILRAREESQRAERETQRANREAQRADHEAQRAEHEAQRAEHEAQRAERFATRLRELVIDPEAV
jgi:Uma2 family endonuclease